MKIILTISILLNIFLGWLVSSFLYTENSKLHAYEALIEKERKEQLNVLSNR